MANGTTKRFNTTKGCGFIAPDDGSKNVFVHPGALEKTDLYQLNDSQKVAYEVVTNKGKTSAAHIHLQNA